MVTDMDTDMDTEERITMNKHLMTGSAAACLLAVSCLFSGCSKDEGVSLENATEVALDDSNNTQDSVSNLESTEKDGKYVVSFDVDNGTYTYTIEKSGIIENCDYNKTGSQTQPQSDPQSEKQTEPKDTESGEEHSQTNIEGFISEQEALDAALSNAGLAESDVTAIQTTLNKKQKEYTVEFVYGDATNQVTVDAQTGEVLSSIFI